MHSLLWHFCYIIHVVFSFLSPPTLSVFSPTSPSDQPIPQWIKPSDYSASSVTLSVFGLGLKTQSSSLHSLSCLPQRSHHPSYVQIPQITPSPSVTSSIFSLKQPITTPPPPLFTLPCRSSLGDHLIPHLLTRSIHHRRASEAPPFKNRRTSLASANVCNALYGERWWDAVERWMT